MLGWQKRRTVPDEVEIDGRARGRDPDAVLRPGGRSCSRLSRSRGLRVVADPAALDAARWSGHGDVTVLRFAPDDAFAIGATRSTSTIEHAIVEPEPGFAGARLTRPSSSVPPTRVVAPAASARPSPRARSPASRPSLAARRRRRTPRRRSGLRRRPRGAPPMSAHIDDPLSRSVWPDEPRSEAVYDVVIIGGGGHGLATAYYLATRHGITNVAVLEADYIASGNTGRNTTIIRANYGIPEAIRFYQHSPRAVPGPRGRDRRRHPPPDQGHRLDRPHRDGDAHRARPGAS